MKDVERLAINAHQTPDHKFTEQPSSRIEDHSSWRMVAQLPVVVSVEVPLKKFHVRDLLTLQKSQVFETVLPETEDVPLMAADIQLGWSEFEVNHRQLVARLTRLF